MVKKKLIFKNSKNELLKMSHLYNDPKTPGSFGGLEKAYCTWKSIIPSLTKKEVKDWAQSELAYTLHCPSRKTFRLGKILSYTIDYLWETDLVDMMKLSLENYGINYLLTVIDTFSKYTWVQPLKSKSGSEILKVFSTILEENHHKPQKLRSDQGIEFMNAPFQQYLEKQNIHFYTAKNEPKSAIIECYNHTLKGKCIDISLH